MAGTDRTRLETYRRRLPFDPSGNKRHISRRLCDRCDARAVYEKDTAMAGLGRMGRGAIGLLISVLCVGSAAMAQANKPIERKLLVASFENIVVIGDIDVTIVTGKSPSAIANGDKRMLESLKLERVGTTLRVRLQDVINNNRGVPITAPLRLKLTTQDIKDVTLSGNGTLNISEVRQQNLARILLSGNGSVDIGKLVANQFTANIIGNGKILLGGGEISDDSRWIGVFRRRESIHAKVAP
jgi:hypothetical protein